MERNKFIILIAFILLLSTSASLVQIITNRKVYKESQQVISELKSIEHHVIGKIASNKHYSINALSNTWLNYLQEYEILHSVKGYFSDSSFLKVITLSDDEYIRIHRKNKQVIYEKFRLNSDSTKTILRTYTRNNLESLDKNWINAIKLFDTDTIPFGIQNSTLLDLPIFTVSKSFDNLQHSGYIGLELSIQNLSYKLDQLLKKENSIILVDSKNNVELLSSSNKDSIENTPQNEAFLEKTLEKNYLPKDYITIHTPLGEYLGKWTSFELGGNQFKVGHLIPKTSKIYLYSYSLITLILISIASLFYFLYSRRYTPVPITPNFVISEETEAHKTTTNTIKSELILEIDKLLETKKEYLNPNFSLGVICNQLNYDRSDVIIAIKQSKQKTVTEYINDHRIKDCVSFFNENENLNDFSMEHYANKFGFTSRTSFYREFKKRTNYAPSEYIALQGT